MYKLLPQSRGHLSDGKNHGGLCKPASSSDDLPPPEFLGEAIFAAGNFWKLEAAFGRLDGVVRTATGYYGGSLKKPNHRQVTEGSTGHTEAVKVVYDRRRVSYKSLCRVFWETHDPTNKDYLRFGVDTHHRSAIFWRSGEERKQAQESKIKRQMKLNKRIVTKMLPCDGSEFYLAENQHQKYYLQKGYIPLCESLGLRSTEQFVESHLACRLNGILGDRDETNKSAGLETLMGSYLLPSETKLALENILQELKNKDF